MKRTALEDFRYPKLLATSDRRWPTVLGWQKAGFVRIKPETQSTATVELTAAGLEIANQARGT